MVNINNLFVLLVISQKHIRKSNPKATHRSCKHRLP